ncbi:unnamed protein product [Pieris macdunnoughi]|uniref:Uncharacterized protein n=1 Tax=Pieris macdunnoughi TaxID=345717 RepID=A0A821WAM1_9NEOP|nr:unnamed protein product [Pieris macdunnoughi]
MVGYQNPSSPNLIPLENLHAVSLNISSALSPLNTLISDLPPFPQSIAPAVVNNGQTPMLSLAKPYRKACNEVFVPLTMTIRTTATVPQSRQLCIHFSRLQRLLFDVEVKKRVQNDDWKNINRKRLANGGKEYSSKKDLLVPEKTMGRTCADKNKR